MSGSSVTTQVLALLGAFDAQHRELTADRGMRVQPSRTPASYQRGRRADPR
ncbi:hypothetical protein V3G39_16045 [Dermatophilaceae bacterium Sec6.4]